ncbi:MAG: hypothetical protein ABW275_06645, partial [Hansschlegelia sp.]
MVDVVFHIGAHKCATTSLQIGLRQVSDADPSLAYISPGTRADAVVAFTAYMWANRQDKGTQRTIVDKFLTAIAEHEDKARIIFSNENMLGPMPGMRWKFYPRAPIVREILEQVAQRYPTSVFLQSRETASFLRSCYQFRVKSGMSMSYLQFLERFALKSARWERLGKILFDSAPYKWSVMPIEHLKSPEHAESVQERIRFLAPGWDLEKRPMPATNSAVPPLARAAAVVLRRAGFELSIAK